MPRSVMVHDFSRIPSADIPRSKFSLSAGLKTTFDGGKLVPVFLQETVPGDTHSVTAHCFSRLATPIHPIMDNLFLELFFFYVPNRLVWDNWAKFMGEQTNPGDSTDYTIPTFTWTGTPAEGTTIDHFGLPIAPSALVGASALPFRALNLIYNEWFRDENLQNSLVVQTGDGPDAPADYNSFTLFNRGKRHDYFTSCLPWPQKGPGVDLPLGDVAPVQGIGVVQGQTLPVTNTAVTETGGGAETYVNAAISANIANMMAFEGENSGGDPAIYADLSNATAASINDLRQAFQIQKLQERDARGGTRLQEIVLSHFGVRGGDARLNRPEYLGGGTFPVGITQVPQTAETATTPQGNLAAYGTSGGRAGFTKSFTEHGYIIGLVNARADLTYQRGRDRHWSRSTKYDFYWPALARIGEQAVLNKEIYYQGDANDELVFGYQERWAEMRHNNSKITSLFRSTAVASLDPWHLSQDFTSLPTLSDSFIQDNPPIDRVIAVNTEPHFLMDAYFQHTAARPMPIDGSPGYIDHF